MTTFPARTLRAINESTDFRISGACVAADALFNPERHDARVVLYNPDTDEWRLFRFYTRKDRHGEPYRVVAKCTEGRWHDFATVRNGGEVREFAHYRNSAKLPKYAALLGDLDKCRRVGLGVLIEVRCPVTGRSLTSLDSVSVAYGPSMAA
jgi:hypothetical protein